MLQHECLCTTQQQMILGHVAKAKATAVAEAAGRPPPSELLLRSASRAAVEAQMGLAVAEHQLAQVEGVPYESWQGQYASILMQVRFMTTFFVRLPNRHWLARSGSVSTRKAAEIDNTVTDRWGTTLWALVYHGCSSRHSARCFAAAGSDHGAAQQRCSCAQGTRRAGCSGFPDDPDTQRGHPTFRLVDCASCGLLASVAGA